MKKLIALALLLCALLISCNDSTVIESSDKESVEELSSTGGIIGGYVVNTATKKYHTQLCPHLKNANEENLTLTEDISHIVESGYVPCQSCIAR
ncbi:MAG: hypothetical protein J6A54_01440 [Clostridia bacterium]|nr:hypothetical protein [Clostridia bacterium]